MYAKLAESNAGHNGLFFLTYAPYRKMRVTIVVLQ